MPRGAVPGAPPRQWSRAGPSPPESSHLFAKSATPGARPLGRFLDDERLNGARSPQKVERVLDYGDSRDEFARIREKYLSTGRRQPRPWPDEARVS